MDLSLFGSFGVLFEEGKDLVAENRNDSAQSDENCRYSLNQIGHG